jgi:nitrite reductase/ring-hydroxylating ferredoxin subunit
MPDIVVGPAIELPPGSRRIVSQGRGPGIGVFNVKGRYFAVKNACPHQGGPLCLGELTGTTVATESSDDWQTVEWIREGEIISCPWHHWEFELETGHTTFASRFRVSTYSVSVERLAKMQVETYPVEIKDDYVVVHLP